MASNALLSVDAQFEPTIRTIQKAISLLFVVGSLLGWHPIQLMRENVVAPVVLLDTLSAMLLSIIHHNRDLVIITLMLNRLNRRTARHTRFLTVMSGEEVHRSSIVADLVC